VPVLHLGGAERSQAQRRSCLRFEHKSRSLSTLEAQLEAEKIVRKKGWEVWAVLDVRQVSE